MDRYRRHPPRHRLDRKRLRNALPGVQFLTHGVPQNLLGAKDLAAPGKY
jgi:site-specific DNA-methyltransferase (adenine-specific)